MQRGMFDRLFVELEVLSALKHDTRIHIAVDRAANIN